jgi:guanine deaminase
MNKANLEFMREAIRLSIESVKKGGGPFGAVVVKNGEIVAGSANSVTVDNDPTAHAEVNAIRKAAQKLGTFDLSGCEIYTSCEPCPMCFGAIYWAHIDAIYYGNTKKDAHDIGFDDAFIYEELDTPEEKRKVKAIPFLREEAIVSFQMWGELENKKEY